ncbi:hypothetical protein AJ85_00150 [Alkalihalobacillus alcalophilus ATCC 27647 = CGMCC 1.3604]|uniref:Uncharacterized protein n=1 Tax=Alkalihalobacillus alcalophilus ATCC 27647 = CGMCC 1.3604 TaxID=1218173 RepID=A0A094YQ03_ALKAL|nr:hypothetical protein [Alkalihalobacillus alcalophilus]KGA95557.1 hypothetical protein BALCAV_0221870 [Alkalihalobacillus alcalophilus ATCC 27647 = CGMCC 1.3604]MED1564340.1 hypothetical protein [Alkalihalobacillus alcalophilus]THG88758.1 hypothetical protein AJ85_00150 [Alkalihalobacillus alcalophilus ATCC 27647 = CGMCC 1.3604]
MNKGKSGELSDLYFIFADNVYEKYLTYEKFKALLNFYSLLYDRIIIPDAFFINNKHLLKFLSSPEGQLYIKNGIIVPSVRKGPADMVEIYHHFKSSNLLVRNEFSSLDTLNILEKIDLEKAIKWDVDQISLHFTNNVLENLYTLDIDKKAKEIWLGNINDCMQSGKFTRKNLHEQTAKNPYLDRVTKETITRYIDISYNFNIPNYLRTSAAYPELLAKSLHSKVTPEQVFFNSDLANKQMDHLSKEEYLSTSLFNEGVLTALEAEQIIHIRKQKAYKTLLKGLKKMEDEKHESKLEAALFDFIYMYEQELPQMITKEIKEKIGKEKRNLKIQTFGRGALASDGVSSGVSLFLESLQEFVGGKVIGSAVNIMLRPMSRKTEREIKKLDFKGKQMVEKIKSEQNIYDTINSFSINSLKP